MRSSPPSNVLAIAASVRRRAEALAATSTLGTLADDGRVVRIDPATLGGLCEVTTRGLLRAWRANGVRRGAIIEGKFWLRGHPVYSHFWAEYGPWWIDLTATQYEGRGYPGLEPVHVVRVGTDPWILPSKRYLRAEDRYQLEEYLGVHERWWEDGAPLLKTWPR